MVGAEGKDMNAFVLILSVWAGTNFMFLLFGILGGWGNKDIKLVMPTVMKVTGAALGIAWLLGMAMG